MSLVVIGLIALVVIVVVILLSMNYKSHQGLKCPHCGLDFTADLFFLKNGTLTACPFCRRWMLVTRVLDRNVVKKLFA